MAKVYVVVVLCCLKALPPSRQCPRRHLRVVVEEVLWDEFDCSVAVIAGGCFGNLIDTQPWRRYPCRCRADSKSQQVADFGCRPAISSSVVMSCITACIPPRID